MKRHILAIALLSMTFAASLVAATCTFCGGTGICQFCGHGQKPHDHCAGQGCEGCKGSGKVTCDICDGTGKCIHCAPEQKPVPAK